MERQEKNWLQCFFETFESQYGSLAFSSDLNAAYSKHYQVDYPEDDDDCYRDALIDALNTLIAPSQNHERFACLVRWCFDVLGVRRNREDLITELDGRLLPGYAFDQFSQMKLYWKKLALDEARNRLEQDPQIIAAKRAVRKAEQEKRAAQHALRKKLTDWRYHEYEPIWGEEMSVTKFIDRLKSDGRSLSWEDFVNGLIPKLDGQSTALKDQLARLSKKPAIYWYPGSGMDFKPLILDTPNNPTRTRHHLASGDARNSRH